MQQEQLTDRLRKLAMPPGMVTHARQDCPQPAELAAWLDRQKEPSDEEDKARFSRLETHLAACPYCLQQLSLVLNSVQNEAAASVPVDLLHRAAVLPRPTPGIRQRPIWVGWAAAAAVLMAVAAVVLQQAGENPAGLDELRTTRYADNQALPAGPHVFEPAEGSEIEIASTVVRWSAVPGSVYYDVRVVDADGEILLRERVSGTRWLMPESLHLLPGNEYFLRVDAWMGEAKVLSSEHVAFEVRVD